MSDIKDLFRSMSRSVLDPDFVRTRRMSDILDLFRTLSKSVLESYFVRVT